MAISGFQPFRLIPHVAIGPRLRGPVGSCGLQATISLIVARMSLSASATRYGDIRVPAFPPDPACRHRAALARARWLMRATSYHLSHRSPDEPKRVGDALWRYPGSRLSA